MAYPVKVFALVGRGASGVSVGEIKEFRMKLIISAVLNHFYYIL